MANISLRIDEKLKKEIKEIADKKGITITEYILKAIDNFMGVSEAEPSTKNIETIKILEKEITEKNKQINELHKLLDQQQQLSLHSQKLLQEKDEKIMLISKEIEDFQEKESKKYWWQFWK